ncbi:MAG: NAD(P)H-hydrate epimerase, partial [Candidatus Saganbacteria bacterium]|nr:NAD(P)H-hydrate epimerase [Candidatus Saganbacteria bacterium]
MRILSREEMQSLDSWATGELGIPRIALMENAGRKVAEFTLQEIKKVRNAVVICGRGGNGGDGLVAARFLKNSGANVNVFLLSKKDALKDEQRINLTIAEKMGLPVTEILADADLTKLKDALMNADVVIDGIFGIGFLGKAEGIPAKAIELTNKTKTEIKNKAPYFIVSIDIPSGIDANTGAADGPAIKADLTVTLAYPKIGLLSYPGIMMSGKLRIIDIGIPKINPLNKEIEETLPAGRQVKKLEVTDIDFIARSIPRRPPDAHKGTFGEVFILAGSPGMTGAAVLCGKGALRVGAGLVRIAVPKDLQEFVDSQCVELIIIGLPEKPEDALRTIIKSAERSKIIALGPGLSTEPKVQNLVRELIMTFKKEDRVIIIDADGLNAIASDPSILKGSKAKIVITPHPGEMSRLTKLSTEEIAKDRS